MIYFVTENYLDNHTPLTANVDAGQISKWVKVNAENWTRKIIGTHFFESLLTKYNNQTLSMGETRIVSLLQPAIAWRAAADCALDLTFQLKNKGITTQSGDNSESADMQDVQFVMSHYNQKAAIYEAEIFEFLQIKQNADIYPDFTSSDNIDSRAKNCGEGNNYSKSIIII